MTHRTQTVDLVCPHCGHSSTLTIALAGTSHNVGFALQCVACPPQRSQRLGFGAWMKSKIHRRTT